MQRGIQIIGGKKLLLLQKAERIRIPLYADHASFTALAVAGMAIVLVTATLVFTDRDRMPLASIADDRAIREERDMRPSKGTALANFAVSRKLSKRETEVFGYLIAGRTT